MAKDKAGIALVLGRLKGKPPEGPEAAPEEAGMDEGKLAAAEEAMAAAQAGDAQAFASALKSFVQMCMDEYGG